jgi:hypothetical protein
MHYMIGSPLREIVAVVAHANTVAARIVAAFLRDDDGRLAREVVAAIVVGREPVVVDVLTGERAVRFVDIFLSEEAARFLAKRSENTFPVVVVGRNGGISVVIAELVPQWRGGVVD